ncbi:MAG TPA: sigma-54-dependent Fis family transcriptional regulator [Xanthobacteraceae bacterium]|nr:sigma-54-dependent Fis family transcriptional regulator [Xanthobacteraceae bacterium]
MAEHRPARHAERVLSTVLSGTPAIEHQAIVGSWRRCLVNHKLDPEKKGPPVTLTNSELKNFIAPMDQYIHLAMPEIDNFFRVVRAGGYCVNLADKNAVMLASRIPSEDEAEFRRWKLYNGSIFCETIEGTNGVGTCLAEERPISVHRTEHFRQHWSTLSCTVAPIFDHRGTIAGALNITSCHTDPSLPSNAMMLAATMQAARRIEDRIFRAQYGAAWIAAIDVGEEHGGLVAFDDDRRIVGASREARRRLGLTDQQLHAGVPLGDVLLFDRVLARLEQDHPLRVRWPDGKPFGIARISEPRRTPGPPAALKTSRDEPRQKIDNEALLRFAGTNAGLLKNMRRLIALGQNDLPILLTGETGTGKDHLARTIHAASSRASKPYVALNCAAMPESLIDSELFGYEAGAFTGARRNGVQGLIARADQGILFLDEIGDMPLPLQTRLLRVLENREVLPLGARDPLPVDFRLISATHQDLGALVREGKFRADLYYRLRGIQVDLPPLRERTDKADLIRRLAAEEAPAATLSPAAWDLLLSYHWPGNIRQLRHALRLAGCTASSGVITPDDFDLFDETAQAPSPASTLPAARLEDAERNTISDVLRAHAGQVPAAAKALGLSRATLYRKIKRLGISI